MRAGKAQNDSCGSAKVLCFTEKNIYKWKSQPTINHVKNSRDDTHTHNTHKMTDLYDGGGVVEKENQRQKGFNGDGEEE